MPIEVKQLVIQSNISSENEPHTAAENSGYPVAGHLPISPHQGKEYEAAARLHQHLQNEPRER